MSRTAVIVCPGRGTYNKPEHGYLQRHHAEKSELFERFDNLRKDADQPAITALDSEVPFSARSHTQGDVASPLIYAASFSDALNISDDIEIVGVTGNSMGWYIALAVAGALSATDGFRVVNTMGTLMQAQSIGGQLIYPFTGDNWVSDPAAKQAILDVVREIDARADHVLALSIDLGGMLVLAGDESGLSAFETQMPQVQGRYPMRLPNHSAFHTHLQEPIAALGREALSADMFTQPNIPMIDGRGAIWWPNSSDLSALYDYTFSHQVTEPYDFTKAIQTAAQEFAPDMFIITGPGNTLGGAVAQSLILAEWQGMRSKADFLKEQENDPILVSMGLDAQRALAES
jgi:acyl transferase domain-containing protein